MNRNPYNDIHRVKEITEEFVMCKLREKYMKELIEKYGVDLVNEISVRENECSMELAFETGMLVSEIMRIRGYVAMKRTKPEPVVYRKRHINKNRKPVEAPKPRKKNKVRKMEEASGTLAEALRVLLK